MGEGGQRMEQAVEQAVAALAAPVDDALSKAAAEGHPGWPEVAEWTERVKRVVLHERGLSVLRSEIPALAECLLQLLRRVPLPEDLRPEQVVQRFVPRLPAVRQLLSEDVEAAFEGDPAAKSFGEILAAYPSIHAIAVYRLAHELVRLQVPQLPRIMTEHAHARTGIDIHPGARIGRRFFIDHGTGVVIGETSEIGDRVRLYHGVTLGAFSPRRGQVVRGVKRHPSIGDDVTIYPGATILGGETVVGAGSVVNGNAYVTASVPPNSRVVPQTPRQEIRQRGDSGGAHRWDL
ncbi:MAG: serine acetyltransferase [Deltaproteobacteria bacterium]|nr:serine acetyltransferase [Deltaproteobacteria bacterium]